MTVEVLPISQRCSLACKYCVAPDTPVLLRNHSWSPIADVTVGDELWSFDEFSSRSKLRRPKVSVYRAIRKGTVVEKYEFRAEALRVIYHSGEIIVGKSHLFLTDRGGWEAAINLRPGRRILLFRDPSETYDETASYKIGYICGISEGDGSVGVYKRTDNYFTWVYQLVMKDEEALDRVARYGRDLRVNLDSYKHRSPMMIATGRAPKASDSPHYELLPGLRTRKKATVGRIAKWLAEPRENDFDWIRGWVAGIFDAEGHSAISTVRISQKTDRIRERILKYLKLLGFDVVEENVVNQYVSCPSVRIRGGASEMSRFFSTVRPAISRKMNIEGVGARWKHVEVLSVEEQGIVDLCDISVGGQPTYFAAGLASHNCYQQPIRDAGNLPNSSYDMEKMKASLEQEGQSFTVFGGESLLVPVDDLEELWRWGKERFGQNSVQTSASIITEDHFRLFKKYSVHVGISLDGPGELNDVRWAGSLERTREASKRSEDALKRLLKEGHPVSLITTLSKSNASKERLPRLLDWFRELDSLGLSHVNLHLMEADSPEVRKKLALTEDENVEALISAAELQSELKQLRFLPITDMVKLLLWDKRKETVCIWNYCDPGSTRAVMGITGQGERVNCSRTNKDGVDKLKADSEILVRPLALYHIPQEFGGCSGCRFFAACGGSCPGEAIRGDWRMKTEHCRVLQRVFEHLERKLLSLGLSPFTTDDVRRNQIESSLLSSLKGGSLPLAHYDTPHGDNHGDATHGDAPHGDHNDSARPVVTHGDHNDLCQGL